MKPRTKYQLLKIFKKNFNRYFTAGLCILTSRLSYLDIISETEEVILDSIFESETNKKKIESLGGKQSGYFWDRRDPKPRIEFLNYLIKKHKPKRRK